MLSAHIKGLLLFFFPFSQWRKALIRVLSRILPGPILYRGASNIRYLLDGRNYIDKRILRDGSYESIGVTAFCRSLDRLDCDLFLDVGANIGVYALTVARTTKCREIICFEPDPMNRNQLAANVFLNGLDDLVSIRAEAVSDRTGSATFFVQRDARDFSSVQSRLDPFEDDRARGIPVIVAPLDLLLDFSGRRIGVKIDVEGHEAAALRGMASLINRNVVYLQIEIWDDKLTEMRDLLTSLGMVYRGQIMRHDYIFDNIR